VSFLRVRDDSGQETDGFYTLVHNRDHTNVAFMFDETARLEPAGDTLTVARGPLGSYPNFFFSVDVTQIDDFTRALAAVRDPIDFTALVETWGVRRHESGFLVDARLDARRLPADPADAVRPVRPQSLRQLLTVLASVQTQLEIGAPSDPTEQPRDAVERPHLPAVLLDQRGVRALDQLRRPFTTRSRTLDPTRR
jgi:hypothetical protein